jgi:hypothetical protein
MLLKADQPSMALLGFVAAIESIAVPRKALPRCPECDMVLGSGERFRAALATVLSPEEIELVGRIYGQRSKTVHGGTPPRFRRNPRDAADAGLVLGRHGFAL